MVSLDRRTQKRKPRHSQSQGSMKRTNRDFQDTLRAWIVNNESPKWSEGLRFVQYQKNCSLHSGIKQTLFEVLFGRKIKAGVSASVLPSLITATLDLEEEVKEAFRSIQINLSDVLLTSNRSNLNPSSISFTPTSYPFSAPSTPSIVIRLRRLKMTCLMCQKNIFKIRSE